MSSVSTTTDSNVTGLETAGRLAKEYAGDVRAHFGGRLDSVVLYGSAARGDWTPESDVDVLVLLDRVSPEDGEWLVDRAVALGLLGVGLLLQPLFMSVADFGRLKARERRFALEVEKEGVEL